MLLARVEHHVVMLLSHQMVLRREHFAIKLIRIKFNYCIAVRTHHRILLRLVHVGRLGLRRLRLWHGCNVSGLMPGTPLHSLGNLQRLVASCYRLWVYHISLACTILTTLKLPVVQFVVLLLQFTHFLDFV